MDFQIKAKDLMPSLSAQITNNGSPVNLTGLTVTFRYGPADPRSPTAGRDKSVVIVNAVQGQVRVDWTGSDTYPAGAYKGEFTILNGSSPYTFPPAGYISMLISPRINLP